jgi:hypothetical protein
MDILTHLPLHGRTAVVGSTDGRPGDDYEASSSCYCDEAWLSGRRDESLTEGFDPMPTCRDRASTPSDNKATKQ